MPYYKDINSGLHELSAEDIANGGEKLLPAGCIPISDAEASAIQNRLQPLFSEVYLDGVFRPLREKILNRLGDLLAVALAEGDTQSRDAILIARQSLLDIPSDPTVTGATTTEELKDAVLALYKSTVAATPDNLKAAFNQVDS